MPIGSGRTKNLRFGATDEPTGWREVSYDEARKHEYFTKRKNVKNK